MADRIDPLGKRALFWVPGVGERADDPPPTLRSGAARAGARPVGARRATAGRPSRGPAVPLADRPVGARRAPTGKHALFSAPEPTKEHPAAGPGQSDAGRSGADRGSVQLRCATCGGWSTVSVLQFARLHLPFFVWRPGPGFARFMTCPACRRRAWISASWPVPRPAARAR